jgi:hypothetical protein
MMMGTRAFRVEEFREAIADLKAARWQSFTDNFFPVALSAAQSASALTWFDDERWRIIANNFGVLARIAAEGGARGFIFDPENYNYSLFNFPSQRQQVDRPFEEYAEAARRRGRQVMAAIMAHVPDAVILSLYSYSHPLGEQRRGKSRQASTYGLLPAFYDGILETMPTGGRLVDGYEFAYAYKERRQFEKAYQDIHQEAIKLSAVPDRYRGKVRAGFGLWLDYRQKPSYFTPDEFRQAVRHALEVSDGYVGTYSNGPRCFPPSGIEPAYIEAIAAARTGLVR